MLISCADGEEMTESPYLNGKDKTPIATAALLDVGRASTTRAANKDFAQGDKLLAYLRHVTWNGGSGDREEVNVQNIPILVTFTKGSA